MVVKPFLKDTGVGSSAAAFSTPLKIGGEGPRSMGHETWGAGWVGSSSIGAGWPDDSGVVQSTAGVDLARVARFQEQQGRWEVSGGEGAAATLATQLAAVTAERDQWRQLATGLYDFSREREERELREQREESGDDKGE